MWILNLPNYDPELSRFTLLTRQADELLILTLFGMISYTFSEYLFWSTIKEQRLDAIIADRSITDSVPFELGLGKTITLNETCKKDFGISFAVCWNIISQYYLGLLEAMVQIIALTGSLISPPESSWKRLSPDAGCEHLSESRERYCTQEAQNRGYRTTGWICTAFKCRCC